MTFLSAVLLMGMVATLEISSNEETSKIYNSISGRIIFEDSSGKEKEFASVLLADNKNLEKSNKATAISQSAIPQNQLKVGFNNIYNIVRIEQVEEEISMRKFNCIKTESIFKHFFISWTRGRGS